MSRPQDPRVYRCTMAEPGHTAGSSRFLPFSGGARTSTPTGVRSIWQVRPTGASCRLRQPKTWLVPVVPLWGAGVEAVGRAGEPGGLAEGSAAPSCRPYPGGRSRTGMTLRGSPAPVSIGSAYVKPQAKARSVRGQGPRMPVSRTAKSARSVTAAGPWEGGRGRAPCFRGLPVPGGTAALAAAGAGLPPRVVPVWARGRGRGRGAGGWGLASARGQAKAGWLAGRHGAGVQKSCAPWMRKVPVLF
jgi:hypothetical protein